CRPAATPPASVKLPNSAWPANAAAQNAIMDHHKRDADPEVHALVADEARRYPLVDHVALLEEQLPRSHRRADDRDDQQHNVAELAVHTEVGQPRHDEIARHLAQRRMSQEIDRHEQKAAEAEQKREPL